MAEAQQQPTPQGGPTRPGTGGREGAAGARDPNHFTWAMTAGVSRSDNIARVSENETTQTTGDLGFRMDLLSHRNNLDVDLSADVQQRKYFEDSEYDSHQVGGANALATYTFIPERFSWMAQDNFGQASIDARQITTPDNRQNTNYFTTGPNVLLPLGTRTDLSLEGRWSKATYEQSANNDERQEAAAGLIRRLSSRTSLSAYGRTEKVKFSNSIVDDGFSRDSAYMSFAARGRRTILSMDAGYSAVHDSGQTFDGPLASLSITRILSSRSELRFDAGTGVTDSAAAFRRDQTLGGVQLDNQDTVITQDPFQSDYARLAWEGTGAQTSLSLAADWSRDDHERERAFNRTTRGVVGVMGRRLTGIIGLSALATWRHEEYPISQISFNEWSAGVGLQWYMSRSLSTTFRGERFKGSGDSPIGPGTRDYTENRVSILLTFEPRR